MGRPPPAEQGIKCPRCDSSNTKFCYYNNYSLSQPRHFCKTCRRYWTKGGALRNVPVGGGCRKSKKSSCASSSSKSAAGSLLSSSSSGPNFSSAMASGVNFQLGMLPSGGGGCGNQFMGFNYPIATAVGLTHVIGGADEQPVFGAVVAGATHRGHNHGAAHGTHSSIASSIESLSSINQDLHWKLQQQRLAMLFGAKPLPAAAAGHLLEVDPISFQDAVGPNKVEMCGARSHDANAAGAASSTPWFLEGATTAHGLKITTANNNNSSSNTVGGGDWNNGVSTWSDMPQFTALP